MTLRRREVLVLMAAAGATAASGPAGLERYRWTKRVVLVFAPRAGQPALQRQRHEIGALTHQPDDRDLQLVEVVGESVSPPVEPADALRRRFGVSRQGFEAVLIGKDGGVKLRRSGPLDGELLSRTIDAMPMRRSEMRHP